MIEVTDRIGVLYIHLFIPHSHSLKDKRMVIKRLKDKIRAHHNVSVGELDGEDKWQRAVLGFSMIGRDNRYIDSALQKILSIVENYHAVEICDRKIEFC